MSDRVARKGDFTRRLLAIIAVLLAVAATAFFGPVPMIKVRAQATAQNIAGTWQGTLNAGRDLRIVFKISKADDGDYTAVTYSIDQGGDGIPVNKITLDGATIKMTLTMIGGSYEGKVSSDGKTITGNWTQGPSPLPLNLTRATPETEWTIPPPAPKIPPMDANASPGIEVATIKPTKPDEQRFMLVFNGTRFKTTNISLSKLLAFSYGVQQKQLIGLPPGRTQTNTTSTQSPTQPVLPTRNNCKEWCRAVADRFKLTFHHDTKDYRFMRSPSPKPGQSSPRAKIKIAFQALVWAAWGR